MNKCKKNCFILLLANALIFIIVIGKYDLDLIFSRTKKREKYIIYECGTNDFCGGMVDRFKGILDSYAWALFTKRHLIVNITKPCNFVNLLVPSKYNWNIDLDNLVSKGELTANYTRHRIDKVDAPWFRDELANMDIISYNNQTEVIRIFTNLEWISAYNKNKYTLTINYIY